MPVLPAFETGHAMPLQIFQPPSQNPVWEGIYLSATKKGEPKFALNFINHQSFKN
jgi:hypothetical protein